MARYVAEHTTVVGNNHKLGVNIISTSNAGLSMGIGEPRLFSCATSLPNWEQTEDPVLMYIAGTERFIASIDEQITILLELKQQAENRKVLAEMLGSIPD